MFVYTILAQKTCEIVKCNLSTMYKSVNLYNPNNTLFGNNYNYKEYPRVKNNYAKPFKFLWIFLCFHFLSFWLSGTMFLHVRRLWLDSLHLPQFRTCDFSLAGFFFFFVGQPKLLLWFRESTTQLFTSSYQLHSDLLPIGKIVSL